MDLEAVIANFLMSVALFLPLCLFSEHLGGKKLRLGLPLYAATISAFTSYAMLGRIYVFLQSQLQETPTGPSKDIYVWLFVAILSALALTVFGWVIPKTRENLASMWQDACALFSRKKRTPNIGLDLVNDPDTVSRGESRHASRFYLATTIVTNGALAATGFVAIAIYFVWPSIVVVIQHSHDVQAEAKRNHEASLVERRRADLRTYVLAAASKVSKIQESLIYEKNNCRDKACRFEYKNRISHLQNILDAFGVARNTAGPRSKIDDFSVLIDNEKAHALHVSLDEFIDKNLNKSQRAAITGDRIAKLPSDSIHTEEAIEKLEEQRAKYEEKLIATIASTIASPSKTLASLTRDMTMALALASELIAVVLCFAAGRTHGKHD